MTEKDRERVELFATDDFRARATTKGQMIHAEVGTDSAGEVGIRLDCHCSIPFQATVIAEMLYRDADQKIILKALQLYALRLASAGRLSASQVEKRLLYSYSMLEERVAEATEKLREKVREQEITIDNLTSALSIMGGGRE